jgi:hypothetical protein
MAAAAGRLACNCKDKRNDSFKCLFGSQSQTNKSLNRTRQNIMNQDNNISKFNQPYRIKY